MACLSRCDDDRLADMQQESVLRVLDAHTGWYGTVDESNGQAAGRGRRRCAKLYTGKRQARQHQRNRMASVQLEQHIDTLAAVACASG